MTDPVHIDFAVGGVADVEKAFQTVDKIMARFERTRKAGGERAIKAAKDEAGKTADAHIKEWQRFQKAQERILRTSTTMAGREAKRAADADIRESKRAEKDAERRAKFLERLRNRGAATAGRLAAKEASAEIREAERATRARERLHERSATMAGRTAERQAREESRVLARSRAKMDRTYGRIGGIVGGTASRLTGTAVSLGAAALTLGGGLSVVDSVSRATSAERAAIALSNSAYIPGQVERPDKNAILARASSVQAATNIDKGELIKGLQKYVALSSDFKGGMGNLGQFAKMAKASGTDFGEFMTAAGTMRVQNKSLDEAGMMNILRATIGQSKIGAIEFSDLAQHAGTITASSGQYAGSQALNQQRLLGLSQLGRRVADPAEAATAVNKLASDVASHATGMEAAGVKVRGPDGLFDPAEIIANLMQKTGGDVGKLQNLGIGERSMKLFNAAMPTFKEAGGGAAGADAVRKEIAGLEGATYSDADVSRDFVEVMAANGEKFDAAMNRVREAMEQRLIPYIDKFAARLPELLPKVERMMDAFEAVASFLMENPYAAIPAIIAAAVSKDLLLAGIGSAANAAIVAAIGNVTMAGTAAGGGGLAAGVGGAGLAAGGAAVAVGAAAGAAMGYGLVQHASSQQVDAQGALSGAGYSGTKNLSEEQKAARIREVEVQLGKAREARDSAGPGALVAALAQGTGQGKELAAANAFEKAQFEKVVLDLIAELQALKAAIPSVPVGGGAGGQSDPRRNQPMSSTQRGGAGGAT